MCFTQDVFSLAAAQPCPTSRRVRRVLRSSACSHAAELKLPWDKWQQPKEGCGVDYLGQET